MRDPSASISPFQTPGNTEAISVIRTPDQRLRIFVSSTLSELADERAAARNAIEELHLTPVMFELGARPHPPRALYRAYLEQSHVFVAIYWRSYGWVAPNETLSGLEDEYELSGERPKLIYLKQPAEEREPRLEALLSRLQNDDRVSFKSFFSTVELSSLLADDLAVLLTERFETSNHARVLGSAAPKRAKLPVALTSFVGRADEIEVVRELLCAGTARIVTLVGPGGIGKTRLAIEAARRMAASFRDGVVPVFLAATEDPSELVTAMTAALGLADNPGMSPLETLTSYLSRRRVLLLLDNFEHMVTNASVVSKLLGDCPDIRVLATSREPLRVSGEYRYAVDPLDLPPKDAATAVQTNAESVRLFVERASRVLPGFDVSDGNIAAVGEICRRLDGLPLAIELAAARVTFLPVEDIATRLDDRLGLLVGGPRDLPERQRTLRATIDWSYNLLTEGERRLFARLAVFRGGWILDAAEAICGDTGNFLEGLSSLLDKSLVRSLTSREGRPRFSMLETAREYALQQLRIMGDEDLLRQRHADYFLAWAQRSHAAYRQALGLQLDWVGRISDDLDNLRAAMRWKLDRKQAGYIALLGQTLWDFWWIRSQLREAVGWMEETLESPNLSARERATAQFILGLAAVGLSDYQRAVPNISAAYENFQRLGDEGGVALAAVPLGMAMALRGSVEQGEGLLQAALATFRRHRNSFGMSYAISGLGRVLFIQKRFAEAGKLAEEGVAGMRAAGELMLRSMILINLAWTLIKTGDLARAEKAVDEALGALVALQHYDFLARAFEAETALKLKAGNARQAAVMFGVADGIRRSLGASVWAPDQNLHDDLESELRSVLGEKEFVSGFSEGVLIPVPEAISLARSR